MNAKVTVEFTIKNVCRRCDYGSEHRWKTFDSLVRYLIKEEGIFGISEDKFRIVSVRRK